MNWKQIALLSLFGIGMGVASVLGLTKNLEPLFWLAIALFSGYWFTRQTTSKFFLHGLLAGGFMGALNSLCQSLFLDTYLAANPEYGQSFQQIPFNPRLFVLISGSIVGIIYGAIIGLLTLVIFKMTRRRVNQDVQQ